MTLFRDCHYLDLDQLNSEYHSTAKADLNLKATLYFSPQRE